MIRALSHDKDGNIFVAEEHLKNYSEWTVTKYPDAYEPLLNILKGIPYADYQRLFPYPNGRGNSAIQRVIRLNKLKDSIHVASHDETSTFVSRFIEDYWFNPYHTHSFTDYAQQTMQHFSIAKNEALDDIVSVFGKDNFALAESYPKLPLVNVLSLTFSKGIEIEEYMIRNTPIVPRNTGIVFTNAYFFDNGRKVHVVLPTINSAQKEKSVQKAFQKNLFVAKSFLNDNFDTIFDYHSIEIRDDKIISYANL